MEAVEGLLRRVAAVASSSSHLGPSGNTSGRRDGRNHDDDSECAASHGVASGREWRIHNCETLAGDGERSRHHRRIDEFFCTAQRQVDCGAWCSWGLVCCANEF